MRTSGPFSQDLVQGTDRNSPRTKGRRPGTPSTLPEGSGAPPRLQRVTVIDDSELVCLSGAKAGGYDVLIGLELISEIGHAHTESLRIAVRAVAGALLRAERAGEVVIGEGNVGAVLRVESYLEEVCKSAAVAVGATGAVGANGSSVNEMIAGRVLGKGRNCGVAIDGFSHVEAPLRPAIGGAIGAGRLHCNNIVGIAGEVGTQPGHDDMAVGICRDPRKHVGLSKRTVPVNAHGRCPSVAQIRGRREKDILVV